MVNGVPDRSDVVFDDERVVVNAGVVLAVTLGRRPGLEALVDRTVRLGARAGGVAAGAQGPLAGARDAGRCRLHR
jgi:hypothetical protein